MKARKLYDDPAWRRLAKRHRAQHPLCAVAGCGKRAELVDHIVNVKAAPYRAFDPSNLQSLCHAHHNILTKAYDAGSIRGACDSSGSSLDPLHPWNQPDNASAIKAANARPKVDSLFASRLKVAATRGLGRRR